MLPPCFSVDDDLIRRFVNYDNRQTIEGFDLRTATINGFNPGLLPQCICTGCMNYSAQTK